MSLSDVFKFTQGLGQRGHQIGRKVGDAIELLTLGMIHLEENLSSFLVIEDGVEGATTAKHKVEFSFYNLNDNYLPTKNSKDLFGLIECKKVGVEVTIKQSFKTWRSKPENKISFYSTDGYVFGIAPRNTDSKWKIKIVGVSEGNNNLKIIVRQEINRVVVENVAHLFHATEGSQILIALTIKKELMVLAPHENLSQINDSLSKCIVISIIKVVNNNITQIKVEEALSGPQTPEKAKQASFVSLDVRKKVLGRFDKTEDKSFISVLVIGEASHWEKKSRSMVRLCNDYNLTIPDEVLVTLFKKFEEKFGNGYQNKITKTNYRNNEIVRFLVNQIIEDFDNMVLQDMDTKNFVLFKYQKLNGSNRLVIQDMR